MTKSQNGNKEAKKPKKVRIPNPPGLPVSLASNGLKAVPPRKR